MASPSPDQSTYILPDANESTQFECKACEWFIREQVWDRGQTLHGPSVNCVKPTSSCCDWRSTTKNMNIHSDEVDPQLATRQYLGVGLRSSG